MQTDALAYQLAHACSRADLLHAWSCLAFIHCTLAFATFAASKHRPAPLRPLPPPQMDLFEGSERGVRRRGCECAGRGRRVVRERLRRLRFGPSARPPISLHRSSQPRTSLWCRSRPPTSQWPHRRPPTSQWPHRRPRTSQWRHRRPPTSQSTPRHRRLRDQPTSATRHPPSRPSPHCLQAPLLFATHTYGPTRAPVRAWAVHTATGQVGAAGVRRSRACRETMPALNSDGLVARACTACARARLSAD